MNTELLSDFLDRAKGGSVLELGMDKSVVSILKHSCDLESFDVNTSPLRLDYSKKFRQNSLVRLPFADGHFDSLAAKDVLGYGDPMFMFGEIRRVVRKTILLIEDSIGAFPTDQFSAIDDIVLVSYSSDGKINQANEQLSGFFSRPDFKKQFFRPGGLLNKFNLLVPEDIKVEVGLLLSIDVESA